MFGPPGGIEGLADALEALRKRLCAYGPDATRCDCKYLLPNGAPSARVMGRSEVTGCPELRYVVDFLRNSDAEQVKRERDRVAELEGVLAGVRRLIEEAA